MAPPANSPPSVAELALSRFHILINKIVQNLKIFEYIDKLNSWGSSANSKRSDEPFLYYLTNKVKKMRAAATLGPPCITPHMPALPCITPNMPAPPPPASLPVRLPPQSCALHADVPNARICTLFTTSTLSYTLSPLFTTYILPIPQFTASLPLYPHVFALHIPSSYLNNILYIFLFLYFII